MRCRRLGSVILGVGLSVAGLRGEGIPVYSNRIVAEVEGTIITSQEVAIESILTNGGVVPKEKEQEIGDMVLKQMIDRRIITKEFERMQGKLPEGYEQKQYDSLVTSKFGGDYRRFEEILHTQGKSKRSYQKDLKDQAIVGYMFDRNVTMPSSVSPREIAHYFDTHQSELTRAPHISFDQFLISGDGTKQIVRSILGENLTYNETCNALDQLDDVVLTPMDDVPDTDLLPQVADALKTMKLEQFHEVNLGDQAVLLGLRSYEPSRPLTIHEASTQIEHLLVSQRYDEKKEHWLNELKQKAYCVVF